MQNKEYSSYFKELEEQLNKTSDKEKEISSKKFEHSDQN